MIVYDQSETVQALLNPRIYPASWHVDEVEVIPTHIALLFLVGDYAFKLKRAVLSKDADFSTPQKRRVACVQEMRRSTVYAPHLIVGIRSVRRLPSGRISIGGRLGEEIDTLIVMRRLKKADILSYILPSKHIDRFEMMDLAEQLAELHGKAKKLRSRWAPADIQNIILENESILTQFGQAITSSKQLTDLTLKQLNYLKKQSRLLAMRQKSGHIRKCHGELLLSNIARKGNKYLFFSPIEYNDSFDCIDTLYDLASLLMDLEAHGQRRLANLLFNHYIAYTNDMNGYPLLPLYQSIRATSRAAVFAKKASLLTGHKQTAAIQTARIYFNVASHFFTKTKPVLIACGGLSGSGKSRIAREIGGLLNPAPGAVILRENIVAKQINGCPLTEHLEDKYTLPAYEQVIYDVLRQQALQTLEVGSSVIVDALFTDPQQRNAIETLAQKLHVPFVGIWTKAPLDVRYHRILERKRNPADLMSREELQKQESRETGSILWHQIETDQAGEHTVNEVIQQLKTARILLNKKTY